MLIGIVMVVVFLCWITPSPTSSNGGSNRQTTANHVKRPNILFFVLDQWRYDWDGMHNIKEVMPLYMPFLYKAANMGIRFTQAYVPTPLCAPIRACWAAGKEYDETGVFGNHADSFPIQKHTTTIYKLLRDQGQYHVMMCGKDDLYKDDLNFPYYPGRKRYRQRMDLGFSDALRSGGKTKVAREYPPYETYRDYLSKKDVPIDEERKEWRNAYDVYRACWSGESNHHHDVKTHLCNNVSFTSDIYPDDFVKDQAIQLLGRKKKEKPWFLQVNFPGPHPPILTTGKMSASVADRTFPVPIDSPNDGGWQCPQQLMLERRDQPAHGGRCNYAAELENIDTLMEEIVHHVNTTLQELVNTVVCIAGDHGEMLGDHQLVGKKLPWQPSISVPLICFGPGFEAQTHHDHPVSTLDLPGTFLDLAGVSIPSDMSTRSLLAPDQREYVRSGLGDWRLVVQQQQGGDGIYKLICCRGMCPGLPSTAPPKGSDDSPWHILLYNVRADLHEMSPIMDRQDIVNNMIPLLPPGWCRNTDEQ